jgi:hypothetical protein
MIPRTIEAIKDDIERRKQAFDNRYQLGEFHDHFSRQSLQRQWFILLEELKPLVAELKRAEAWRDATEFTRYETVITRLEGAA